MFNLLVRQSYLSIMWEQFSVKHLGDTGIIVIQRFNLFRNEDRNKLTYNLSKIFSFRHVVS